MKFHGVTTPRVPTITLRSTILSLHCDCSSFLEDCARMRYEEGFDCVKRKFFGKLHFFTRRKEVPRNQTNDSWNFLGWKNEKKKKKGNGGNKRGGWNVGRFFSWFKAPVSVSTFQSLSNRSPLLRFGNCGHKRKLDELISWINFSKVSGRIERNVTAKGEKVNFIRVCNFR